VVVFDITQRSSFTSVVDWVADCRVVPIGNKVDLRDADPVEWGEAEALRKQIGAVCYVETSALTGQNIQTLFSDFAAVILDSVERKSGVGAASAVDAELVPNDGGTGCC
jgi:GTPase SAR1 family protein